MSRFSQKCILLFLCFVMTFLTGCYGKLPDLENHTLEDAYDNEAVVFKTVYSSEVINLNYLVTSSAVDTAVCANVIDALVDYDTKGNIIPGLAESWESNEDFTEWTFHLRDGIKWVDHNGNYYADVVADDFVCAAEYVNNAANDSDCQYMYSTGAVVLNAQKYYEFTSYVLKPDDFDEIPEKTIPSDIGVVAEDDKTLKYILEKPCPFFTSVLSYTTYLPICRKYLNEIGSVFATDNEFMLYNGAYILHYFKPLEKQIFVKNPTYWDKKNVYLDRIENYYDADALSIGPEQYMNGSVDKAIISPDHLDEYMSKPEYAENIHRSRPDSSFSYFYSFNFEPLFDKRYEPDNWKKAVENLSFRKAVMSSIDRVSILKLYEPYDPEILINNTITPKGSNSFNGKDYTSYGKLAYHAGNDSFDSKKARIYRDLARLELTPKGVTFPIKMLMPYNPSTEGWKQEAYMMEEQIESTLGKDFIDVIVTAVSDMGFLLSVRMSGKYAFMKCRWGADYEDPQTWTEPFEDDGDYTFWQLSDNSEIKKIHKKWQEQIDLASSITDDNDRRFTEFAEAENIIISNAIVVPFSIMNGDGYIMSKLNEFEGEYSSYGMARQRYKYYKKHEKSMNLEEYEKAYAEWIE